MAQLNIKHHSGVGVQSNLGDKGNFFVFVVIEGIFLLIPSQTWSHWVDYSRNEADLKSSISWDPSFWLLQCEPSRRHGRARCDKEWAVESCSPDIIPRHHPQTSSTTSWRQQGAMESSTGFASDIRCVQGRNILCSLLVVGQTNLVSLYGNPGAPHRAPSTQRFLCPRSFLTDFCALCPRALLTPRILTGLSKLQPNSRELHEEPGLLWLALCLH